MNGIRTRLVVLGTLLSSVAVSLAAADDPSRVMAGAARVDVTPTGPVLLAGYGGRTTEHEGVDTKLWARALVLGAERPAVLVALDNCGITAEIQSKLAARLRRLGVTSQRLVVAATHTHNAPTLEGYAPIVWAGRATEAQQNRVQAYTEWVVAKMAEAVSAAIESRQPMELSWSQGRAGFGGNRRVLKEGRWTGFGFQRDGPVDHSLPVLVARDADGRVRIVWTNYACHCTTVGSRNRVGGDWAGFANDAIEADFPHAVALTTIGCGADVGPQPTGSLQLAMKHGRAVGKAVGEVVESTMTPLDMAPEVEARRVQLPLDDPPPRSYWEEQLRGQGFHQQHAQLMLSTLKAQGEIPREVDYPITVWRFGDRLAIVFLAGEVVVDYSVRLKRELDWSRLWLNGWSHDMPGYIPSKRVLKEGGYEAEFSQIYYGQPCRYSPQVEDVLVAAVKQIVGPSYGAKQNQRPSPFHRTESGEGAMLRRLASRFEPDNADSRQSELDPRMCERIRQRLSQAVPGIASFGPQLGEEAEWHNYAGDVTPRRFIRQTSADNGIQWKSPAVSSLRESVTFCFHGGLGWESEPKTKGFLLAVSGRDAVRFDVSRKPARWTSADGTIELLYLPTWTSPVDSAGFFFLTTPTPGKAASGKPKPVSVEVRALGAGSKRWFAIDAQQEGERLLEVLRRAVE